MYRSVTLKIVNLSARKK